MAISLLDNFSLGAKKPNFARDLFDTVADMAAFSENYLPDVFECNVKENGNRYRYNVNNTVDSTTGKWRLVDGGGGSDLPEVINNRFLHTNSDTGELEWSTIEAGNNIIEQYDKLPAATFDEYNNKIIFNKYDHEFYLNIITRSSFRKYTNSNNETIYIKEINSGEIVYIFDRDNLLASTNYELYVTEDYFGYYDIEGNDHNFFADDFESTDLYRYCFWKLYRSYETSLPEPNNDDNILISYNNHWNQTSKEDFLSDKQDKLPDEGYGFLYKDSNTGEIEWVDNDKLKFRNTISPTDQPYLYTGHCYEKPNWEKINEFMEDKFLDGGCSGAVRNGKFYRSFDFLYNDTASFVIENHACGYKGMAGAKPEVTKTLIDNGGDDEWFDYLPFDLLDGINLSGIAVSTYILHREGDRTNQGDLKQKICTSVLATYLLCNLKDIDDLADVVDEICVYAPNSTEHPEFSAEYHWMISNGTKTVCLEYVNNSPVITDISANPYIANFYLYDWDGSDLSTTNAHAQGIERWNILKNGGSLEDVAYTNTYSLIGTDNVWRSDFNDVWQNGIDITTTTPDDDADLLTVQELAYQAWQSRTRGNGTWHTQHACIYDFETRSFKVCTQEDYDTWYPNGDSVEIDDTTTAIDKVWSSDKVDTELSDKASLTNDNEFLGQIKFPTEEIDEYTIMDNSYIGVYGNGGNNASNLNPGYLETVEKAPYGDPEFWGNTNYHAWGIEHVDRGKGINCNIKFPSTNGTLATKEWVEEAFGVDFIKCVEFNPVADVFVDPKVIFNTTSEKFYSLKNELRSFKKYTNTNEETIYVFDLVDGADVYSTRVDGRLRPTRTELIQEDDYFIYSYTEESSGTIIEEYFYAEDYVENVNDLYGYWEEIEIGSGSTIQVDTLPTASATELGKIYQFIGISTENYLNGSFYKCVTDGTDYSWVSVDTFPSWRGTSAELEEALEDLPIGTRIEVTDDYEDSEFTFDKKRVICIGDSYNKNTEMWDGWGKCLKAINPNIDVYSYEAGGGGFVANTYQYDFLGALQNHSQDIAVPDNEKDLITDIIVLGCYNDMSIQATQEQLNAKVSEFMNYCKANYPNAKVTISSISIDYNSSENMGKINTTMQMYRIAARLYGATYFEHFKFILRNKNKIYFSDTNPNSGFHPNTLGNTTVANYINEYLYSGYFDVKDGAIQCSAFVYSVNGNICISPSPENGGIPTTTFLNNEMNGKSFPFNTWVDLGDISNSNGDNLLWGAINGVTAYWQANVIKQITPTSNEYCSTMFFKLLNKHIYANNLSNTDTLVFDGSIWTVGMSNMYFDDQLIY